MIIKVYTSEKPKNDINHIEMINELRDIVIIQNERIKKLEQDVKNLENRNNSSLILNSPEIRKMDTKKLDVNFELDNQNSSNFNTVKFF